MEVLHATAAAYDKLYQVGVSQKSTQPDLDFDAVNQAVWLKLKKGSLVRSGLSPTFRPHTSDIACHC